MNNRMGRVSAAEFARLRSQKPLPKRGQIKSKIAANAFHSIVSSLFFLGLEFSEEKLVASSTILIERAKPIRQNYPSERDKVSLPAICD
ncbi:hypothetical protein CR513_46801, partial [Mucuna pruriens]